MSVGVQPQVPVPVGVARAFGVVSAFGRMIYRWK
jgi:hypothetical protein